MMSSETNPTHPYLAELLAERARAPDHWSSPAMFDLAREDDARQLEAAFESGEVLRVTDQIEHIANDLFELQYPDKMRDPAAREEFVRTIHSQGPAYGKWFLFPWSGELVRYPDRDDHRALHTSRNRNLITAAEQQRLYNATLAVFGLSVGSNIVDTLLKSGIGGTLILADMDAIEPSNSNRIDCVFSDVGMQKLDKAARDISEVDPYIEQVHLREGVNADNLEELIATHRPDIIFEELDDLRMKAVVRLQACRAEIPVVMATDVGHTSLLGIERYDKGTEEPFNGRLDAADVDMLLHEPLTPQARMQFIIKMVGGEHLDRRMIESVGQVGKTLPGLPQLGITAAIGGELASAAAREILLERGPHSGRSICSTAALLGFPG